jgi:ribosome-associated protein
MTEIITEKMALPSSAVDAKAIAPSQEIPAEISTVVEAAEDKKALDVLVLRLSALTAFTDYFVICSGNSSRQIQAISDEIELRLKRQGTPPFNIEGYNNAEWVLMDYGSFVVHIFSGQSRNFYDLERLWRDAEKVRLQ